MQHQGRASGPGPTNSKIHKVQGNRQGNKMQYGLYICISAMGACIFVNTLCRLFFLNVLETITADVYFRTIHYSQRPRENMLQFYISRTCKSYLGASLPHVSHLVRCSLLEGSLKVLQQRVLYIHLQLYNFTTLQHL